MILWSTNVLDHAGCNEHMWPMNRDWPSLEAWKEEVQVNRTLHLWICRGAIGGNLAFSALGTWRTGLSTDHIGNTELFLMKAHKTQSLPSRCLPQWGDFNSWGQAVSSSRQIILKGDEGWAGVLFGVGVTCEVGSQDGKGSWVDQWSLQGRQNTQLKVIPACSFLISSVCSCFRGVNVSWKWLQPMSAPRPTWLQRDFWLLLASDTSTRQTFAPWAR